MRDHASYSARSLGLRQCEQQLGNGHTRRALHLAAFALSRERLEDLATLIVASISPPTGFAAPCSTSDTLRIGFGAFGTARNLENGMAAMNRPSGGSMISNATAKAIPPKYPTDRS